MLKKMISITIFLFIIYTPLFVLAQDLEEYELNDPSFDTKDLRERGFQLYEDEDLDLESPKKPFKTESPEEEYPQDWETEYYDLIKEKPSKKETPSEEKGVEPKSKKKEEYEFKEYKPEKDYPSEEDYQRNFLKDYGEEEVEFDQKPVKEDIRYREYYDPEKELKEVPGKKPLPKPSPEKSYQEKSPKKSSLREREKAYQEEIIPIASKPSWLFSIPTAFVLDENDYRLGFPHAEIGMGNNIELIIPGLKWQIPRQNILGWTPAVGIGLFANYALGPSRSFAPLLYGVFTQNIDTFNIHLGLKVVPYWLFGGVDYNLTKNLKFTTELNDGLLLGLRYILAKHWNIGLAVGYGNYKGAYQFNLKDKEGSDFCVLLDLFYFNKFKE
ncbi:hypothetical protein KJ849_03805 [bacterium]|nr:hypothetical protein [bacterium]